MHIRKIYNIIMGVVAAGIITSVVVGVSYANSSAWQNRKYDKGLDVVTTTYSKESKESVNDNDSKVITAVTSNTSISIYSDSGEDSEEFVTTTTKEATTTITPNYIEVATEIETEVANEYIDTTPVEETTTETTTVSYDETETEIETEQETTTSVEYYGDYTPYDLYTMGVIYWGGYRYTWYSELVLAGGGLNIEGRHVDTDGFVCDGEGYICVASGSLAKGTVVNTPFGRYGKVYDCGCAYDVIDCYVHW